MMKSVFYLLSFLFIAAACSPYQTALKSEDNEVKLATIDKLIEQEKYGKAVAIFEQIIKQYRGTDKAEELSLKYAHALYNDNQFPSSAYQYERFVESHPTSEKREFAQYMGAKSHAQMSQSYSRDQRETSIGLAKLQDYINAYPDGEYLPEANKIVAVLRDKLDRKAYEIAKNYHKRGEFSRGGYITAIASLKNFIQDHPGSDYLDDAQYYLIDSQYEYAIASRQELISERLDIAKEYYDTFAQRFPESEYQDDAVKLLDKINDYPN